MNIKSLKSKCLIIPDFNRPVHTIWPEEEDRWMIVTKYLCFTDSKGILWEAKPGSIIDGASIPRICWVFIGSPFVGKYRRASVIHDVYCDTQTRAWKDVHKVFYEMMLVDGVSPFKAWLMFKAVWCFGPRW